FIFRLLLMECLPLSLLNPWGFQSNAIFFVILFIFRTFIRKSVRNHSDLLQYNRFCMAVLIFYVCEIKVSADKRFTNYEKRINIAMAM
ncbi:hypothetical protein L9F63_009730, partial [Diploptera punctata]